MRIIKRNTKDGNTRYEVHGRVGGRGSKYIRRRFDRKIDAENFVTAHQIEQADSLTKPKTMFTMAERTFEEESHFWLTHCGIKFSPGHKKRAQDSLAKCILPKIGRLTLDKINPVVFSKYRLERLETGLKPASVNRETEVMMAVLNYAVKQRRIPYNPAAGFTKLDEIREDIQFWERSEAENFLKFADQKYPIGSENRWVYVVYLLALNTSLRAGEIWGLKPKDLSQGEELLHIQRQFDLVVRNFRTLKGKESRYVPCNSFLRAELKQLIEHQDISAECTVFCTSTDRPMDHYNFVGRYFEKDIIGAKVKKIRFHDLRHTATTLMIAQGLDIKTVQVICGHKDITTTMRYVHLLGDSIKRAARVFSIVPEGKSQQIDAVA